ncbi:MAG: hypothetical protein ABSE96_11590 [Terracidiphilus sp.]|jgi:hypothetical protein
MSEDVVWNSNLDGRYTVTVIRTEPYRGDLSIHDRDQLLHRESVGLAYGALFGPDVDDIGRWQKIAEDFIDKRGSSTT